MAFRRIREQSISWIFVARHSVISYHSLFCHPFSGCYVTDFDTFVAAIGFNKRLKQVSKTSVLVDRSRFHQELHSRGYPETNAY
jgi:hypothetical protein